MLMTNTQIIQMLESGQNDLKWFNDNIPALTSQFNNNFIAFRNHKVIDSDQELRKLISKLKEKNIDSSNVLIRFISEVKYIL